MGPTEYGTTILLPKSSQSLPRVSLLKPGIPNCNAGNGVKDVSCDYTKRVFPLVSCPGFMVVTPSFTHLSVIFCNQRFRNCSPTVDVGFVKLASDSVCGNRVFKFNIQFCCPVTCAAAVLWFFETILLFLSMLIVAHCSSSLMLPSHDSCTPT
jgi:hypothetical protein